MTSKKSKPAKKKVIAKKKKVATKKKAPKKKIVVKKKISKAIKEKKIGKLLHYFDKIKVIVIKLSDTLSVGDTIHVKGGKETDFKQKIVSMEIDGEKIKKAKKGQKIGVKVKERAREGYQVFKI
jgi:putative protease